MRSSFKMLRKIHHCGCFWYERFRFTCVSLDWAPSTSCHARPQVAVSEVITMRKRLSQHPVMENCWPCAERSKKRWQPGQIEAAWHASRFVKKKQVFTHSKGENKLGPKLELTWDEFTFGPMPHGGHSFFALWIQRDGGPSLRFGDSMAHRVPALARRTTRARPRIIRGLAWARQLSATWLPF